MDREVLLAGRMCPGVWERPLEEACVQGGNQQGTGLPLRCICWVFPGDRAPGEGPSLFPSLLSVKQGSLCPCPEIPQPSTPGTLTCPHPRLPTPIILALGPSLDRVLQEPGRQGRAHWAGLTGKAQAAAAGDQLSARGGESRSPEEAGQGRGGAGRGASTPPPSQEGESRGAFVPCQSGVTTWCPASLSLPGTKDQPRSGAPGLWGLGTGGGTSPVLPPHCHLLGLPPPPSTHKLLLCSHCAAAGHGGTLAPSLRRLSRDPRSWDLPTVLGPARRTRWL